MFDRDTVLKVLRDSPDPKLSPEAVMTLLVRQTLDELAADGLVVKGESNDFPWYMAAERG